MNSKNNKTIARRITFGVSTLIFISFAVWLLKNESSNLLPIAFSLFSVIGVCSIINDLALPLEDSWLLTPEFEYYKTFKQEEINRKHIFQIITISFGGMFFLMVIMFIIIKARQPLVPLNIALTNHLSDYLETPLFLEVAKNWYGNINDYSKIEKISPLYPIVLKIFSLNKPNVFVGIFLNIIFSVVSAVLLYCIAIFDYSEKTSLRAVIFMFIFPTSFFLILPISLSLFLSLSLLYVYLIRKREWFFSFVVGYLLGFVHPYSIALFFFGVVEFITMFREEFVIKKYGLNIDLNNSIDVYIEEKNIVEVYTPYLAKAFSLAGIPMSLTIYTIVSRITYSGKANLFLFIKELPSKLDNLFFSNIFDLLKDITLEQEFGLKIVFGSSIPFIIMVLFFVGFFMMSFIIKIKLTMRASYLVYAVSLFIITFSSKNYLDAPKYMILMFPIFLISSDYFTESRIGNVLMIIYSLALIGYFTIFILGYPIY